MDAIYDADMVGTCEPGKLFVEILGRLPAREIAVSRLVSRKWRAAVDDNNLLLLPGITVHSYGLTNVVDGHWVSPFFAAPATSQPKIGNGGHGQSFSWTPDFIFSNYEGRWAWD
jgi:hypothetical protein